MSANAIEELRDALHGYQRDIIGRPGREAWDALAAVEALLEVTKRAIVYWDADDVDSLDSVMLEVEKAIRRMETGQ